MLHFLLCNESQQSNFTGLLKKLLGQLMGFYYLVLNGFSYASLT